MSKGEPKEEYLDTSENVRHWSNLRFAQLTVFIAITAGLTATLFQAQTSLSSSIKIIIKIAGLLIVAVFWITEERTMMYWRHFIRRAAALEQELGFQQYSMRPREGIISSANAVRVLFVMLFIFWLSTLIWT
jgi:hypothetical protein